MTQPKKNKATKKPAPRASELLVEGQPLNDYVQDVVQDTFRKREMNAACALKPAPSNLEQTAQRLHENNNAIKSTLAERNRVRNQLRDVQSRYEQLLAAQSDIQHQLSDLTHNFNIV